MHCTLFGCGAVGDRLLFLLEMIGFDHGGSTGESIDAMELTWV
jgi:hypothetical protein